MLASPETRPLIFSPVRSAVTQPRWPRLTEPGCPRQTHTSALRLSRDPHPACCPRAPSLSCPVLSRGLSYCAQDFPPLQEELFSQDRAGAGLRPGRPAPTAGSASPLGHL